jgi:hypothetical protein
MDDQLLQDEELNKVLAMASTPVPQEAFAQRLLSRLESPVSNVIAFPAHRKKTLPWIIGLPLAASLVLGLWLGNAGIGSTYVSINPALVSENSDDESDTGFDDMAAFIEDSLT